MSDGQRLHALAELVHPLGQVTGHIVTHRLRQQSIVAAAGATIGGRAELGALEAVLEQAARLARHVRGGVRGAARHKRSHLEHAAIVDACIGIVAADGQLLAAHLVHRYALDFDARRIVPVRGVVEEYVGARLAQVVLQDEAVLATTPEDVLLIGCGRESLDAAVVRAHRVHAHALAHVVHVDVAVGGGAHHQRVVALRHELDAEYVAAMLGLQLGDEASATRRRQRIPHDHAQVVRAARQQRARVVPLEAVDAAFVTLRLRTYLKCFNFFYVIFFR